MGFSQHIRDLFLHQEKIVVFIDSKLNIFSLLLYGNN